MSKYEDGSYGSLTGIALIGKVLAGRCGMAYTRAAVGSGAIPDDKTPKTMEDAAGYVMDARIAAVSNPVDGECQVTVQIKSDDVETGFYATNIVLFANDPDLGEVPYTYLSLENEPEWIRPASSIVGKLATFDLVAAVGDVDVVSAIIDPETIATIGSVKQFLHEHDTDAESHADIREAMNNADAEIREDIQQLFASVTARVDCTIPTSGWTEDTDTNGAYAMCTDVTVFGVEESMVPLLTIMPAGQNIAKVCEMCNTVRTMSGKIRVYAQRIPAKEIVCSLALLCGGGSNVGSSTVASDAEISEMLGDVFSNS